MRGCQRWICVDIIKFVMSNQPAGREQQGAVLIKVPASVQNSIVKFSTSYNQRQADNNNNLVRLSQADYRCLICLQNFPTEQLDKLNRCSHSFCHQCLHNYLLYKIQVGEEIECPVADCSDVMTNAEESFERLPERYKTRYQQYRDWKGTVGGKDQIICPEKDCRGTVDFGSSEPSCDACSAKFCEKCHLKKHGGSCDDSYGKNFVEWKRCPDCKTLIERREQNNKMTCECGYQFCFVCNAAWSDYHYQCQQEVDPLLDYDVCCRQSIMESGRCWNFIRAILLILCLPFILILIVLLVIVAIIGSILGGLLFSPCLSRLECESLAGAIFCFPCVGVYKAGQFVKDYVGQVCGIGCDNLKRWAHTIRALCCYDGKAQAEKNKSTAIEYAN